MSMKERSFDTRSDSRDPAMHEAGDASIPVALSRRHSRALRACIIGMMIGLSGPAACRSNVHVNEPEPATPAAAVPAENPAARKPGEPTLNPSPRQIVRIHGKLPRHLRLAIYHRYGAERMDEDCMRVVGRGTLRIPVNLGVTVPASVRRKGDRFESELVVDRYLPGPCGWKYEETRGNVWKAPAPDPNQATIILFSGDRYDVDDSVPGCPHPPRMDGLGCKEERYWRLSNHDERIPVQVRCKIRPIVDALGGPDTSSFRCTDNFDDSYKKYHLIMPFTQAIEMNVYDLDIEKVSQAPTGAGR